jgi:hypothetical protein
MTKIPETVFIQILSKNKLTDTYYTEFEFPKIAEWDGISGSWKIGNHPLPQKISDVGILVDTKREMIYCVHPNVTLCTMMENAAYLIEVNPWKED